MNIQSFPIPRGLSLALWTVFLSIAPAGLLLAEAKPNVVVIFVDDLGYGDIGPYGATKQKTPHLNRMADQGMKLTSFYAAPVCSVSRAQLLTGCYGARVSVPGVFGPGSRQGLHPEETTIAERLKERGYATMCIGKWHVGDQPEFLPTRQGFDRYFGIPYSNDMQRVASANGEKVVPLLRDDKVIELLTDEQQSRIVERYTDEAVSFIRDNKDKPFFLYLPHTAVHTPIWPGEKFRGKSNNGRFGDWVEEVDWSVGRIMETLGELRLDKNTLVVFTSDNGPWLIKGSDGGSALPLRGGKGSTWEGGVRVPTIAWWPGKIAPGSRCDAVAGTIDLLPTAVSIAGGTLPPQPVIDGRDISPLLFGQSSQSPREAHYYFAGLNLQAVRQGPWKLAIATQPETMGKGANDDATQNPRLYNLDMEIGERTNLAAQHPEVVARLQALAAKMAAEIGGNNPAARRPAGQADNPTTLYPSQAPASKPANKPANQPAGANANRRNAKIRSLLSTAIPAAMESEIAEHHAAGVVTLVMHNGKQLHASAVGYADRDSRQPMQADTLFWIASMTKSISATTVLTLVDEGKLSLDEPASKWLPELAHAKLASGQPPSRPITLRDLLSHSAGIAFPPRKATDTVHSLRSYTLELIKAPLAFEPGSNYEYGFGITVAGRIAELVSGKSFDHLVQERVLDPLSMSHTTFFPDDSQRLRIAKTYRTSDDGKGLTRANNPFVTSEASDRRMVEPSGGLFSTASDMARFYQMILDGGVANGKRIVSQKAIDEMTRPHVAGGRPLSYGLGWQCSPPGKPAIAGFSQSAFGHGGAFGTHGWIDPEKKLITVFMVQNALVEKGGNVRTAFHAQVVKAFAPESGR